MAHYGSQSLGTERIFRAGVAALALAIGVGASTLDVAAQQAPAKKAAPAAASKGSWVKLCEQTPVGSIFRGGKEEKKYATYCLTQIERLDANTGLPLVTAAVRQMDGEAKQFFHVIVPLGMLLKPGMRGALYPKDLWELVQKNEKVDESKLRGLKLEYTLCHPIGCTAEVESTPELIEAMKTFGGMVVFAINSQGEATALPVPLAGFEKAHAGPPVDTKQYMAARKQLQEQIAQRQKTLAEQQKKKAEQPAAAAPMPAPKK